MISRLILDAGPLIGLFVKSDVYHHEAVQGIIQLRHLQTRLVVPLPVVWGVHKFLLYNADVTKAGQALDGMKRLHINEVGLADLADLELLYKDVPTWRGSLEDASVIVTARRLTCPVWTLNYRDFAPFKDVELWNPRS